MANSFVQVQLDQSGKKVDTENLTVGANDVHRQRVQLAGVAASEVVVVTDAAPGASDFGLVVRTAGAISTATVTTSNAPGTSSEPQNPASTTLLAANVNRLGATFFNDATADLYLKIGTTASLTDYTVRVASGGYYELPQPVYTGAIDGIWSGAGGGSCRVTELT